MKRVLYWCALISSLAVLAMLLTLWIRTASVCDKAVFRHHHGHAALLDVTNWSIESSYLGVGFLRYRSVYVNRDEVRWRTNMLSDTKDGFRWRVYDHPQFNLSTYYIRAPRRFGFSYENSSRGTAEGTGGFGSRRVLLVPHWFLVALAAVFPSFGAARLARRWRSRRRARQGLCPRCGYDLRGAPGVCPECGAAAPLPAPSPTTTDDGAMMP